METTGTEMDKKLSKAGSIEEVKSIIEDSGESINDEDAKLLYDKIKSMDSDAIVELSVEELDAVAGGRRDYMTEGCKATVEYGSNCWGNDFCAIFNVWYERAPEANCPKCGAGMGRVSKECMSHIIKCPRCGQTKKIEDSMEDI